MIMGCDSHRVQPSGNPRAIKIICIKLLLQSQVCKTNSLLLFPLLDMRLQSFQDSNNYSPH